MRGGRLVRQQQQDHTDPADREVYVHGYSPEEQQRLQARRATGAAAFFLPYLHPGWHVVDCGCGPGSITVGLAEAVAPGQVVGVDIEPRQVAAAQAFAAQRGVTNAAFQAASIYALPFPDATFDAAFANTVLLHLREPLRALAELRRVLKPGGVVGIADGDFGTWLWEPSSPLLEQVKTIFLRFIEHQGGDPYRARRYRRLLLDAGFVRSEAVGRVSSDTYGADDETRRFASRCAQLLSQPMLRETAIAQGWATDEDWAAMVAEVVAWGERPDAFMAILDCAAVGWV